MASPVLHNLALGAVRSPQAWIRNFKTFSPMGIGELPKVLFAAPIRPDLIQRVTVWYRAGIRAGTACTKERGEVRGSIRKLYPQKGTGRARMGASRTNLRVGGGVCFGPKPKDWAFHLPEKILAFAFRSALSAKYLQNELVVVEASTIQAVDNLSFSDILASNYKLMKGRVAIIDTNRPSPELAAQIKELPNVVFMVPKDGVNAYHLLDNKLLIITTRAIEYYSELYNDGNLILKK